MKRHAPATLRNRDAILAVLREELPAQGVVLEIASGSGEHVPCFAENLPQLVWQPSDPDPDALASILAWSQEVRAAPPTAVLEPVLLEAAKDFWPVALCDAILCSNMVHISPWAATQGLMRGAGNYLGAGAPLILYGPYRRAGVETAPSNEAFDASLRARNPDWGLRDLEKVQAEAEANGLRLSRIVQMPANNLTLVFRKG